MKVDDNHLSTFSRRVQQRPPRVLWRRPIAAEVWTCRSEMMMLLLMLQSQTAKQRESLWRHGNQTPLFVYILEVGPWRDVILPMTSWLVRETTCNPSRLSVKSRKECMTLQSPKETGIKGLRITMCCTHQVCLCRCMKREPLLSTPRLISWRNKEERNISAHSVCHCPKSNSHYSWNKHRNASGTGTCLVIHHL